MNKRAGAWRGREGLLRIEGVGMRFGTSFSRCMQRNSLKEKFGGQV